MEVTMCNVIRLYRIDPKNKTEISEVYAWDVNRKVNKALLQKSKAVRLELWSIENGETLVKNGWFPARRADGTQIESSKGYRLYTYPERELKPFPY